MSSSARTPALAVVLDLAEERWPSMQLSAEMLLRELRARPGEVRATSLQAPFRARASLVPRLGRRAAWRNADRLLGHFWDAPRWLRARRGGFDLFHVCDHTYAQLVHVLPPERTGVFCHDLDAFRCLLTPERDPRPRWFRWLARRTLAGLQKAALVFHTTAEVRRQIERHALVEPARLVQAPYGVAPSFLEAVDAATGGGPGPAPVPGLGQAPFLLHVGSCIPRKRIDVLLDAFALLRERAPASALSLVQVGGEWTPAQRQQIARHGLWPWLFQVPHLPQPEIAWLYRRAALVLLPSQAEGFGLPLIEALSCGAIVLASDIPVHREVGGEALVYAPLGRPEAWAEAAAALLADPARAPPPEVRRERARGYSWKAHADVILAAYLRLLA